MKYSLITFFVLFAINNLLHYVSEKVIIVIFITFLFFLMRFLSNIIHKEFSAKVEYVLNDINLYMNAIFDFLYITKLFYLNLKSLKSSFQFLTLIISKKLRNYQLFLMLNRKTTSLTSPITFQ